MPQFSLEELMCIAMGSFTPRIARGYLTSWVEDSVIDGYAQHGNYVNIQQHHEDCSQVSIYFIDKPYIVVLGAAQIIEIEF